MSWLREPDAEPIPGYRLVCPLGTGGFGEVWKCVAPGHILKAIKFVYGNLNSLDGDAYRAEQELKALQKIKEVRHPFILSTERIDVIEGDLAIVMELAESSLHDRLQECRGAGRAGVPRAELLGYLRDAADGLDFLNEKHSLLHLDVKPRNLFLVGGRVKVADFGLVKTLDRHGSSGLMAGVTPLYASPETFSGKFSRTSDQYSLAVMYVEMLTGERPFNGKNIRTLALQHVSEPPDLSGLPEHDRPIVARALAKDPEKRWPSCMAFVRALAEAAPCDDEVDLGAMPTPGPLSTPPTMPRGAVPTPEPSASLDRTTPNNDHAVLCPTLVIGVGEFGRRAMLDLRCRLLDRFGDLSQLPIFRFLYLDTDPDALHRAQQGEPEIALAAAEVFPLPLQPVTNYRRRALEHLSDWLPREKLHAMPRSLQPHGSRALGRLAFHDNYLRFATRLRRELQVVTHPETIARSVAATGLVMRDNQPRVAVLASACGGTAGMLVDLAYAVAHQAAHVHARGAAPTLFLFCGAPTDPATPPLEQANVFATLTELNHYHAADTGFSAQYGPDSQPLVNSGAPYSAAYLLTLANRTPAAHVDCVARLANYLGQELTTTLGSRLEQRRALQLPGVTPFRSLGTHSVWYPRGLLLRLAARQVCESLIREWEAPGLDGAAGEIEAACAKALADPGQAWEPLAGQIDRAAYTPDGTPPEVLARLLTELGEAAGRPDVLADPADWARRASERVEEWVGPRAAEDRAGARRSRFAVAYKTAVGFVADDWEQKLLAAVAELTERPGRRTAVLEAALGGLLAAVERAAADHAQLLSKQRVAVQGARAGLRRAIEQCAGGGGTFGRLLGLGAGRQVRNFLDQLRAFAGARLAEDTLEAGAQFYKALAARLQERLTDLGFVRQRLRHLRRDMAPPADTPFDPAGDDRRDDPMGNVIGGSSTVRVVLPDGLTDFEAAARRFVDQVTPPMYRKLDEAVQALVLAPLGGLLAVCRKNSDLARMLSGPLLDQTAAFLGEHLPAADVAEVEISAAAAKGQPLEYYTQKFFRRAAPLVAAPEDRDQTTYLLHPDSAAAAEVTAAARRVLSDVELLVGSGPTDITFCREQGYLTPAELAPLMAACQPAYDEFAHAPAASPHSRFDVPEWLPLEV